MLSRLVKVALLFSIFYLQNLAVIYAASYEDTSDVNVELTMVVAPNISLDDSTMTFDNLVAGDIINATQNVLLTGTASRSFTCTIDGENLSNFYPMFDGKITMTVTLNGCTASPSGNNHILSVTTTELPITILPSSSDSVANIAIMLSYNNSTISTYN